MQRSDQEIKTAQIAWANSNDIPVDSRGYVHVLESNLWKPLSAHAREGFERGAGSELTGHMKALHASSALVANFFDYWTERDTAPLLSALGVDASEAASLDFEAQSPTGLLGTPPHLDVAINFSSGGGVGLESKFTEHLSRSTIGKSKFEPAYLPKSGGLWAARGLPTCQALAEELNDQKHRYEFLDPWQLLRHALGLATVLGNEFSLYYLYYDCVGDRSETHKTEVRRFADRVGEELRFKALTYQEVYARLRASGQAETDYLDYLGARYFNSSPQI